MSINSDYYAYKKKKEEEEEEKRKKGLTYDRFADLAPIGSYGEEKSYTDVAPVAEERTAFQTPKAFEDLWENRPVNTVVNPIGGTSAPSLGEVLSGMGGIVKATSDTLSETGADLRAGLLSGILGMGENVVDFGAFLAGGAGKLVGADEFADKMKDFVAKDLYDERAIAEQIVKYTTTTGWKNIVTGEDDNFDDSVLGAKADDLAASAGQLIGTAAAQYFLKIPWFVTTGVTSFGSGAEAAFAEDATYLEAGGSAAISAGAEILSEKLFGGIKFGGKTLDDVLVKPLVDKIANKTVRTLVNLGVDMAGEGFEEVFSQVFSNLGTALYKEESIDELLLSEQAMDGYLESLIGGMVLGGGFGGAKAVNSVVQGTDYKTGLTENETKVFEQEYADRIKETEEGGTKLTSKQKSALYDAVMNDLKKGYISTDKIESVLGGEAMKLLQGDRKGQGSYLAESYNESVRTGQKYEARQTKYTSEAAKTTAKLAVESGVLNNTNRAHELVDLATNISEGTGAVIGFTNNKKLAQEGRLVDGKPPEGYTTPDGFVINVDSKKYLNSLVGHELTHKLKKANSYGDLEKIIVDYAKARGDYDARFNARKETYKKAYKDDGDYDAKIREEVVCDLVGDYLFTDVDFVSHLAQNNRNVFQKVWDEIKYLWKSATAGSKEARELEKVKRTFEKVYREIGKQAKAETKADTKYSLSDGKYTDTFYSHMAKVVDDVKQDKLGAASVVNMLRGKGVKAEEIKWSGIEAFLEGKKSVTKQELQEFARGSMLEIDTVEDDRWDQETVNLEGGSNYREILFKLPNSDYSNYAMRTHWGEDANGILAHARIQDFNTKDGKKMLFVEEIQSDWHNEGKKEGYADTNRARALRAKADEIGAKNKAERARLTEKIAKYLAGKVDTPEAAAKSLIDFYYQNVENRFFWKYAEKFDIPIQLITELDALRRSREEALKLNSDAYNAENGIPDAPFHNNYHEYVLKRLIREAAEKGYDSIGWTTADIQSNRWSDEYAEGYRIEYDQDIPKFLNKYGKKWGAKVGKDYIGTTDMRVNELEERLEDIERDIEQYKDELADDPTEEYAEFIRQGLSNLYDSADNIRKILRGTEVWSMPITPAMKQSVLYEGQVMYSLSDEAQKIDNDYLDAVNRGDTETAQKMVDDVAKAWGAEQDENGKPLHLYHGTPMFGFTEINVEDASDDSISFFATNNPEIAQGYMPWYEDDKSDLYHDDVRRIGKPEDRKQRGLSVNSNPDDVIKTVSKEFPEYKNARVATDKEVLDYLNAYWLPEAISAAEKLRAIDIPLASNNVRQKITNMCDAVITAANENTFSAWKDVAAHYNEFDKIDIPYDANDMRPNLLRAHIIGGIQQVRKFARVTPLWNDGNITATAFLIDRYNSLLGGEAIGIYDLYAKSDKRLVIQGRGSIWNDVQLGSIETEYRSWLGSKISDDEKITASTRDIAEFAKHNGYRSVVFYDIYDSGAYGNRGVISDVYAFFYPKEDIKSADPVTYDDSGNVIPLSQRFNVENNDIRYSISTETEPMVKPKVSLTKDPTKVNLEKDLRTVRAVREETMRKNGFTAEEVGEVNQFMDNLATFMEKAGVTYRFIGLDDVNNAQIKVTYDKNGNPKKIVMSAMVKNGEYPVNFDLTRICKKRESMSMVIKELAKRSTKDGRRTLDTINLNAEALWTINEELRKAGLETACLGCFVESKRYNIQAFADKAVKMWNGIVDEVRADNGTVGEAGYFDFAGGVDLDSVDYGAVERIFADYQSVKGRTSPEARMRALIQNGGEMYQRYLQPSDLMTPEGIEAIKAMSTKSNDFYGILKGVYGQAAPKEVAGFSPYNAEIALLPKTKGKKPLAEYIASIGGVRMQSFSDFLIANVYDYMQMVADLAARHLPAHAYTKEIAFAKIFGMTGIKINMSVMFDIDANLPDAYAGLQFVADPNGGETFNGERGYWDYLVGDKKRSDAVYEATGERPFVQSIGFDEAVALQSDPRYSKNCGIIGVGMSDLHILKMLGDDRIRFIIPYHASSLPAVIAQVTNIKKATDYTDFQNTRKIVSLTDSNGNAIDLKSLYAQYGSWGEVYNAIAENVAVAGWNLQTESDKNLAGRGNFDIYKDLERTQNPKQSAENYLQYCAENNYVPIFERFAFHENYYKLLYDFDVYDTVTGEYAPQTEVKNIYSGYNPAEGLTSTKTIEKIIASEMEAQNEINMARNAAMPGVVNEVLKSLGADGDVVDFSLSLPDDADSARKPYGDLRIRGEDVAYTAEDIAPIGDVVTEDIAPTTEAPLAEEIEDQEGIASVTEEETIDALADEEIKLSRNQLQQRLERAKEDIATNERLRSDAMQRYNEKIASIQARYDAKKNKNTKEADGLRRSIARNERLRDNIDADYAKRIANLQSKANRYQAQIEALNNITPLDRKLARIDARLKQDEASLKQEFQQRKADLQQATADKNAFISQRADELYWELSSLKKGVKASAELGYLLDYGYKWSDIKTALVNTKLHPEARVNQDSVMESVVRDYLNKEYEDRVYEIDEMDTEYQAQVEELRSEADKARKDARKEEGRVKRAEYHASIINDLKAEFTNKGYDLDKVLKNAKNLSTIATVDNTPQRVMEKALGGDEGKILADFTVNKAAQNESEGIKWLNGVTDRKSGLLADLLKQYHIKPGSKESAAAQMYGEGFYADENGDLIAYGDEELAKDFPNETVRNNIKGLVADSRIREFYDETLDAINAERVRNGYPEIPRLPNYYLHYRAMDDTFSRLGVPFNPNDIRAKDLPTDINGMTVDLKPGQPYFSSAMHRKGNKTTYDLLGGLERYAVSAKNQIYHIGDIQRLRALRNYLADTFGQAKGLEGLDDLSDAEVQERINQVFGSHLSSFAKFLNEEANVLAGKTSLIDRGLEGIIGRRGIQFLNTINGQVGSNMVGMNVSSSLTNFLPIVQTFAKTNKADFVKGFAQTVSNRLKSISGDGDTFAQDSPVMIRRKGADRFYRTPWQKAADIGYTLMSAVDSVSTEIIARTKFNEFTKKGMDAQQAHIESDKWASRLMGDRSLGQLPLMYNSKTLGLITKFQLEVRNQLDSQFYDTIQEAKASTKNIENAQARNAKIAAKVASTFVQLAVAQHLFGMAFEAVAGYNPAFDIIDVLIKTFGFDDDEDDEDTVLDNIEEGFLALLEDLPYTSTFTGGRIPIASALPIKEVVTGKDEYGNEKPRLETLGKAALYYLLPTGYGQIRKTVQGLSMFDDNLPVSGSYTDSGNLRFPVEDTFMNRVQAGLFGQWASQNASDYFDGDIAPLPEKQVDEYKELGIPIQDYWEYREGLADKKTLEEKFDYIAGLDLPVEKKNILINNIVNRENSVDMSDYNDYGSYEEFEFATKNPGEHSLTSVFGGYNVYKVYSSALGTIKADEKNTRKENVVKWLNSLDADYGMKMILFRSQYKKDNTYNAEIVEYLNSRDDISYEEMVSILTELGFTVNGDSVTW